jgi:hypothetical protein
MRRYADSWQGCGIVGYSVQSQIAGVIQTSCVHAGKRENTQGKLTTSHEMRVITGTTELPTPIPKISSLAA